MAMRKCFLASIAVVLMAAPTTFTLSTPAADAAPRCPAYPAFPDAACTGPTTDDLSLYTGSEDFRTEGQIIENVELRVNRGVYIAADNVMFRNVKFVWDGPLGDDIITNEGAGTTFEDCLVEGRGRAQRAFHGDGTGLHIRNCEISGVGNAVETETPLLVEENYIHDIRTAAGTGWHADGVQVWFGDTDVTVRHNTIILTGAETGAIQIQGDSSDPAEDILVVNNLFAGGGYTMYTGVGKNYRVIDNHMSTQVFPKVGYYNIWYHNDPPAGEERHGNVIHETGEPADRNI